MRSLPLSEFLIESALANSNTVELRALLVGNEQNPPMWQYETIHLGQQEEKLRCDRLEESSSRDRFVETRQGDRRGAWSHRKEETRIVDRREEARIVDRREEARIVDRREEARIVDRREEVMCRRKKSNRRYVGTKIRIIFFIVERIESFTIGGIDSSS